MKFLLDENVDLPVVDYLTASGHDVTAVALDYVRSIKDHEVLEIARAEGRILIWTSEPTHRLEASAWLRRIPHPSDGLSP